MNVVVTWIQDECLASQILKLIPLSLAFLIIDTKQSSVSMISLDWLLEATNSSLQPSKCYIMYNYNVANSINESLYHLHYCYSQAKSYFLCIHIESFLRIDEWTLPKITCIIINIMCAKCVKCMHDIMRYKILVQLGQQQYFYSYSQIAFAQSTDYCP